MRYFRAQIAAYSDACQQLDAEYGYPNAKTRTDRTLPLAETLPTDEQGRVYIAISTEYCQKALPSQIIASGEVEEISAGQYWAMFPPRPGAW